MVARTVIADPNPPEAWVTDQGPRAEGAWIGVQISDGLGDPSGGRLVEIASSLRAVAPYWTEHAPEVLTSRVPEPPRRPERPWSGHG